MLLTIKTMSKEFAKLLLVLKEECIKNSTCSEICNQYREYIYNTERDIKEICDISYFINITVILATVLIVMFYMIYKKCMDRRRDYIMISDELVENKFINSEYFDCILGSFIIIIISLLSLFLFRIIFAC